MEKLLKLEEVADVLGVEYKTVYRLVRAGKLPAGRIGRCYRVSEQDLTEFFEASKRSVAQAEGRELTPLAGPACCVTGKRIVSETDIAGYATDTGEPICRAAWDEGWRTPRAGRPDPDSAVSTGDNDNG